MAGVNKVIIIGNLGRDPEIKYTQSNVPVANFSVATSESWKDKQTDEWQEKTEWHRIVAWRHLAERAEKYLRKGKQVYIEGKLVTRKWQGEDGVDRYTTEIVAAQLQLLGKKEDNAGPGAGPGTGNGFGPSSGPAQGQPQGQGQYGMNNDYKPGQNSGPPAADDDDGLPF